MDYLEVRFALRDLTKGEHEKLDSIIGKFSDAGSYARYLQGMTAFRGAVEDRLAKVEYPKSFGSWRPGMILSELEQDLTDINLSPPHSYAIFEVPEDRGSLLGVLYVLEGSSLGARLLSRRAAAIGYSPNHGARHLAAQTSRPEAWKAFVALLNGMAPVDTDMAVEAARMTFRVAIDAFTSWARAER
jgi:heme oxygenase (biliverdin-IX-beta and delta-forming)